MSSGDARLLFDECLPRPFVTRLIEFLEPKEDQGIILCSLLDFASSGTFDEVWVPRIKDEGWTVISADGGRTPNRGRGKKLPQLCAESGITLILLSPSIHARKALDKARTIVSVWDRIIEIATNPADRGRRFMVEPLGQQNLGVGRITERPIRTRPNEEQGKTQE